MERRTNLGSIPYEALVVVLVAGMLMFTSIPRLRLMAGDAPEREAALHSSRIADAIQSLHEKSGAVAFNHPEISINAIEKELGGQIPTNPCTGGNSLAADYGMVLGAKRAEVQAVAGDECVPEGLPKISLGSL